MIHYKKHTLARPRGFTIFFAMLIASLALAIGLAIYDLTVRELNLSSTGNQSQYAIFAADTGAECALYWDSQCTSATCPTGNGSAFATSTASQPPTSGIECNQQDVAAAAVTGGTWPIPAGTGSDYASTTFEITFASNPYCAVVEVGKYGLKTIIISHGYNTCTGTTRVERALQVTY